MFSPARKWVRLLLFKDHPHPGTAAPIWHPAEAENPAAAPGFPAA